MSYMEDCYTPSLREITRVVFRDLYEDGRYLAGVARTSGPMAAITAAHLKLCLQETDKETGYGTPHAGMASALPSVSDIGQLHCAAYSLNSSFDFNNALNELAHALPLLGAFFMHRSYGIINNARERLIEVMEQTETKM